MNYDSLDLRNNIQTKIKNYIDKNKITFRSFAKEFNVSDTTVKRWYYGVCLPDINLLPSIAKYMDITTNELIGLEVNYPIPSNLQFLIELYSSNDSFKTLVDKYRDDKDFRLAMDTFIKLMK